MMSVRSKLIIGITASVLVLGGIGIASSQLIDANAANSPFDYLPPEKRVYAERQERIANKARAKGYKKEEEKLDPSIIQTDPPIKTEILDFVDDPLRNKVIEFMNGWITPTENGRSVSVGAGALVEDPEQGVVLVRHYDEKRLMVGSNIVKTPEKVGKITIKDYNSMTLTLVTDDGKELEFNVEEEKFN